jgi:hypothetical protein
MKTVFIVANIGKDKLQPLVFVRFYFLSFSLYVSHKSSNNDDRKCDSGHNKSFSSFMWQKYYLS